MSKPTVIKLQITNQIFIPLDQVQGEVGADLKTFCQKELNFFNPKIIDLKRMGYSVWGTPKYINCFKETKKGWEIPTGFLGRLKKYALTNNLEFKIADKRVEVPITPVICNIKPKPVQEEVLAKLEPFTRVILEAKPGFGKTMAALLYFTRRQQKTLVIVHTRALLQQWQKRIADFFELEKGDLGQIGEGKWQIGTKITIASYQTLLSRGVKEIKDAFGLVIIDECHHVPSQTFTKIAKAFDAKYYLGLSATPFRKDKLDKLMLFYIGPIIASSEDQSQLTDDGYQLSMVKKDSVLSPEDTHLILRQTKFYVENPDFIEFTELGSKLIDDQARNQLILRDVGEALGRGGKCLVLSERVAHCEFFFQELTKHYPKSKIALITGQIKKADREKLLHEVHEGGYDCLVATGSVIGEGFDWPAIDHLFLVYPFSWKGKLIQYVGRAQRLAPGKKSAFIYDYVDGFIPMLKAMARRRASAYRELGINAQSQTQNQGEVVVDQTLPH